jgi:hypothetical protein
MSQTFFNSPFYRFQDLFWLRLVSFTVVDDLEILDEAQAFISPYCE